MTEKAVALLGDDTHSVSVYKGGKFRIRGENLPWDERTALVVFLNSASKDN
jgi:hypothetical protein